MQAKDSFQFFPSITGHVVGRVRLETLTAEAYAICIRQYSQRSDTQVAGLKAAVGKETANLIAKGCKVHFIRSVKCVSERINKGSSLVRKAFTAIAYHIPKATTPEDVTTLFNVLVGEDVSEAAAIMPECSVVQYSVPRNTRQGCGKKLCTGQSRGSIHNIFVSKVYSHIHTWFRVRHG